MNPDAMSPDDTSADATSDSPSPASAPVRGAAPRILYVDDDPGLGRLVQRALRTRGYAVELATDGEAGLARLGEGGIDVVALDHHMPGQTGLDVLPAIRALPDAPPVIYVTGSEDSRVAVAALKAGAVDYVWKDVQGQFRELLGEAIDTALRQETLRRDKERADLAVREARDRAEILLREVNHRVANSLALVAALAHMQTNAVSDPAAKAALLEMQTRIQAIAGIHRRLYTSDDVEAVELDAYLSSLVEELQAAMKAAGRDHAIRLAVEPVRLATDKAVSLGVIVTELVTNAYKYAYAPETPGEIRVALGRHGADGLRLTVADDGVGWTGEGRPRGTGLGSRIVKAMATNLRSVVVYDTPGPGTRATLCFQD
jgi:two-component sensor histidine kinase